MATEWTDENSELQRARAGDPTAFRQLVLRHQALVFGSALRLTGQRPDALELAQEVFLRLHAALPRITSPAHLMRWLSRVLLQRGQVPESAPVEVAADPGADFAARVVARVQLRWSHRRRAAFAGDASSARGSSRARFLLPAVLAAAVIAAVVLTLWWSGALQRSEVVDAAAGPAAATGEPGRVQSPPAESAAAPGALAATLAASQSPALQDPYRRYTVIAMPPRHESRDPAAQASVAAFYTALLVELRGVPGIALLIPGVTAPPTDADRPADYLLTVTSLDTMAPASGGLNFRGADTAGGGTAAAPAGLPSAGIATLLGGRAGSARPESTMPAAQWPVEIRVQPIGQPDSGSFTAILQIGADTAQLAARQVEMLRQKVFPDAPMKLQLLARMRDASLPATDRSAALDDLLGVQQRAHGEQLDATDISAILEQSMAMRADQRAQLWRSLRRISHPDLVEPLLDSLRRDADEGVRFEALATLAANYMTAPQVRAAIELAARQDPQQIVRIAARRALHGDAEWRAFVVATLKDTGLSNGERLMPLLVAARSAVTSAETRSVRAMLQDQQVLSPLVDLVRDGWFESAEADTIADAVNLLANVEHPAAFDLFVQVLQEPDSPRSEPPPKVVKPAPPQISPEAMAWLLNHRSDPRVRRILQDIADGKADQQLVATVEMMRKSEPPRPRIPRRP